MDELKEKSSGDISEKNPDTIIRNHVAFSMVAGAIPLPIVDIAAVTAIQVDMLHNLADHYNVDFNLERGKSLVSAFIGAFIGTSVGRIGASAVKAIPGIGTLLGIGSQVVFSGASTYAIGMVSNNHFKKNGTLFDFDIEKMKKPFKDAFEAGKDFAKKIQNEKNEDDVLETIKKLKAMKDSGVISDKEFEVTKKKLLDTLSK